MRRLLLTASIIALTSAAHAQLFTDGASFVITTQNSPNSGTNNVLFNPGTTQNLDGGALQVTLDVINATDFATTGRQWVLFSYNTPNLNALSSGSENWSIEQVSIPLAQSVNFIADFTQFTRSGDPIDQVASIFGQTLGTTPVPGQTGNGEGNSGFKDAITGPSPAPQLGAFADPFNLVITGLGGVVPTGFTQALEFEPGTFVPPVGGGGGGGDGGGPSAGAVPEPSTWAMLGLGFAALAFMGFKRSSYSLG